MPEAATTETGIGKPSAKLPPGPSMPKILQAWNMSARMPAFLDSCARKFGDRFTISMPGIPPQIMFADPGAVKMIFTATDGLLMGGMANSIPLGGLLGPDSLVRLDGATHHSHRRTLLSPFQADRMEELAETICAITDSSLEQWPTGQPFKMFPVAFQISLQVVLAMAFGAYRSPELELLRSLVTKLMTRFTSPILLAPRMRINLGLLTPWGPFVRLKQRVHDVIDREIARRRRDRLYDGADLLSVLLKARSEVEDELSDEQIRDELLTMIVAGSDTTASAISWGFYRIAQNADVAHKLETELTEGDLLATDLFGRFKYLDAVIKETLRLHPIILAAVRWTTCPLTIDGTEVPQGAIVAPCSYLAHRREQTWSEPNRFLPERFLGIRPDPYTFFPFGGGDRRCVGMSFALVEMKLVLARALARLRFRLPRGYVARPMRRSVTFAPSDGLPIITDLRP